MKHAVLAAALNALIDQRAHLKSRLASHAGRDFMVSLPLVNFSPLHFLVSTEGNFVSESLSAEAPIPDLSITLSHWPQLPLTPESIKASVRLQGHAALAESLAFVFANLDPKPGDLIQGFVGDIAANRADRLFALLKNRLRGGNARPLF